MSAAVRAFGRRTDSASACALTLVSGITWRATATPRFNADESSSGTSGCISYDITRTILVQMLTRIKGHTDLTFRTRRWVVSLGAP
ncbi:hypothetical protein GCM10009856_20520 [Mycolicibacterium llatzerense]